MAEWDPFLTFVWTDTIDDTFQKWLESDFIPRRLTFPRKTRAIIAAVTGAYTKYSKAKHDTIVINHPLFDFSNEIVVYGKDKVAILMYSSHELSALLIQSNTLHTSLKAMFNFTRETQKESITMTKKKKIAIKPQKLQKKR
jgi:hypothetical protein